MTKSARTPQQTADAAKEAMSANDHACKALGIEFVEVGPSFATLAMVVRKDMTNGHGMAHGGFIFALADTAFAYACNSHGHTTVAAHCSITFIRPAQTGERLVAVAREISHSGRSGIFDIKVSVAEKTIAEFRGHSRTIGGSFIGGEQENPSQ
jgi:acyl-CoA thioesterase